ncbi:Ig-like domain-containing protein [Gracilimonas mengyeensis]|uniref:Ig-like domain-containing protein n=1 Tax=Gracilimonas mengyeensis TaxID=1302730 RepID=UPI001C8F9EAA|nr:Ig-like domain-containing protein [Gracilimonas mengyeensis]
MSNVDSPDYNGGFLEISDNGANNTASGNFSVDGTNVTSGGDATIAAGETIAVGGTSIGTVAAAPNDGQGGNTLEINTNGNSTNARMQTLLRNLRWSAAAGSGAQTFTLTLNDADGIANGGDEDAAANFTMTLGNPPVIANLGGDAVDFLVDGPAVNLDALAAAGLTDSDNPASLSGGSLTATVSSGAAAAEDVLTLDTSGGVTLSGTTAGSNVSVSGTVVGTLASNIAAGNDLQVNFTANATLARVATLLQAIQYSSSASPLSEASRQVSVTVSDNDGLVSDAATITVTTVANQAPALSATGSNPAYLEGGGGTGLFSGATASTTEAGQSLTGLTLTVTNLADGADEILRVDGTDVALTDANSVTTATNSLTAAVSVSSTTATVSVSGGSLSPAALQTLVNGLTYRNTSDDPETTNRGVTITSLSDNGGTANGGDDTASLSIGSTISITPVNDAPTLSATGTDPTYTDGDAAVALFTGAGASTVETGQAFTQLTFLVANLADGADEKVTIDGTELALTDGTTATSSGNNLSVSVSVTTGTATVTVSGAGIAPATMNSIIEGLAYRNSSYSPSTGTARTVMLTGLTDDGGTANGGDNAETFAVSSSVSVADQVRPAPALASSSPASGATGAAPTAPVTATFDKDVSVVDLSGVTITGGGSPAGGVSASLTSTTELSITHNAFATGVSYTVTIPAGALQNVDGVANGAITWSFTTVDQGPQLTSSDPADGATGVDTTGTFTLTYDQRLYPGDLGGISLSSADGTTISGLQASLTDNQVWIAHPDLKAATSYTLSLPEGAVRNSGLVAAAPLELSFTTTLGTPQVTSTTPAEGTTGASTSAPLTVGYNQPVALTDTAEYRLTGAGGQQVPLNASAADSALTLTHEGLEPATTYTLTLAHGALANGEDIPSAGFTLSFTTSQPALQVMGTNPEDNATMVAVGAPVEVRWSQPVEIADSLGIALTYGGNAADPAPIARMQTIGDTLRVTPETLLAGRTVELRLAEGALANADGVGNAAFTLSFTTAPAAPDAPELIAPSGGALTDTALTVVWRALEGATYRVQVATSADFTTLIRQEEALTDTSLALEGLARETTYHWRVQASGPGGTSGWASASFTTRPALPGSLVLLAPADEATDVPVGASLRWSSASRAAAYQVQIADGEDFTRLMMNAHLADTTTRATNLAAGQDYHWRVRAKNGGGAGPWSPAFRFSTLPGEGIRLAKGLGERTLAEDFDSLAVAVLDTVFTNLGDGALRYEVESTQPLARASVREDTLWLAPVPDAFGALKLAVTARDESGNALTDTLAVTITAVNDAPRVALPADTTFGVEGSVFELAYGPFVADPESPLEDLTIEIQTGQEGIAVSVDPEAGLVRVDAGDYRGLATAELRVSDPEGALTRRTLRVDFMGPVSAETEGQLPVSYNLAQNYPNPFNPTTAISYGLPEAGEVRLEVYNMLGRRVAVLAEGRQPAGTYTVRFDGAELSSGVYLYRLVAGGQVFTRKLTLIK